MWKSSAHPHVWLGLSVLAAACMAVASSAGIFVASTYAQEAPSWAAQGVGQDIVNLVLAVPLLVVASIVAVRGSPRARDVWIGTLIYTVYSFVLYAFFVHFGPLFLVYVATLGLSAYALLGVATGVNMQALADAHARDRWPKAVSVLLMAIGAGFAMLWLADIVRALATRTAPTSVKELGFPVNPVHVLDLAFLLPAMITASVLLWKRRALGFLLAGPLLTFGVLMGLAIAAMAYEVRARGA